jgi:hypothetical protein
VKSRLDHHPHQLLHQQFACVWDPHLTDVLARLTRATEILLLLDVRLTEQTALRAHMHSVAVTHVEQTLLQESTRAVTDHAVTFHLSET